LGSGNREAEALTNCDFADLGARLEPVLGRQTMRRNVFHRIMGAHVVVITVTDNQIHWEWRTTKGHSDVIEK